MEGKFRCVTSPGLAKELIREGYIVKDIRPDRSIENATVFIFDETDELNNKIFEYRKKMLGKKP